MVLVNKYQRDDGARASVSLYKAAKKRGYIFLEMQDDFRER